MNICVTLGVNWRPATGIEKLEGLVIRPELRYDHAFEDDTGIKPFDAGTKRDQFTIGIDVVIPFSLF